MGLPRVKFGKRQNCDNIRSMTLSGVTVTGINCTTQLPRRMCWLSGKCPVEDSWKCPTIILNPPQDENFVVSYTICTSSDPFQ